MLTIMSWWPVLLHVLSDPGGLGLPGTCRWMPGTAPSWSSGAGSPGKCGALRGPNSLPAHVADLASTQPWWFKILVGVFVPHTPWPSPTKAKGGFPGSAECGTSPGELTGSAFRTRPSLLLPLGLLGTFFVQHLVQISIKLASGVCKEQK